jgi:hypothetical protein
MHLTCDHTLADIKWIGYLNCQYNESIFKIIKKYRNGTGFSLDGIFFFNKKLKFLKKKKL